MKRSVVVFLGLALLGFSGWSMAGDNPKEMAEIKVPLKKEYQVKMGKVVFPHARHFLDAGHSCGTCHHVKKSKVNGKFVPQPMTVEKVRELAAEGKSAFQCKTCHGDLKKAQYKKLFHRNCLSCHKKLRAQGKKLPVKCRDCHVKPKRRKAVEGC